ncbi:MAG: hypothetical protein ACREGR_03160 [Minisyncoccia bacterium]
MSVFDKPECVAKMDAACDRFKDLLVKFCEEQELPFAFLEKVPDKVRYGKIGELTIEEVSPASDALEMYRGGHTGPYDADLDVFRDFFMHLKDIILVAEIREDHRKLCEDLTDICPKCQNSGQLAVVCGWCQNGVPHGSCDDTYQVLCDCRKGIRRRKEGCAEWHGHYDVSKERVRVVPEGE